MFYLFNYFKDLGPKENSLPIKDDKLDTSKMKLENVCCLVAFLICVLLYVIFFIYSMATSNFKLFTMPSDSSGMICGYKYSGGPDMSEYPYLFSPDGQYYNSFCVKSCPTSSKHCLCNDTLEPQDLPQDQCLSKEFCIYTEDTYETKHHVCIPTSPETEEVKKEFEELVSNFLQDLLIGSWKPIVATLISILFCVLWFAFMSKFARCCVWTMTIAMIILVFLLSVMFLILGIYSVTVGFEDQEDDLYIALFVCFAFFLLAGLITAWCTYLTRERIDLIAQLIGYASNSISDLPCLPIVSGLITILSLLFAVIAFFSVIAYVTGCGNDMSPRESLDIPGYSYLFFIFVLFTYFWVSLFIMGINSTTVGGAVGVWYFIRDKSQLPSLTTLYALGRSFRYHSGAVSFGSLIIAIIKIIRVMAELAESSGNSGGGGGNDGVAELIIACICCCIKCLLRYIEEYLSFLADRAYLLIGIRGGGFYERAKQAFFLILRNIVRTVVLENIVEFLTGMMSILIFLLSVFILVVILRPDIFGMCDYNNPMVSSDSWWLLLIIGIIIILFCVVTLLDTYEYTIRAVFMCFLLDEEMQETNEDYHYFAPEELSKKMYTVSKKGFKMATEYKEKKNTDFDMAFVAEPPDEYQPPAYNPNYVYNGSYNFNNNNNNNNNNSGGGQATIVNVNPSNVAPQGNGEYSSEYKDQSAYAPTPSYYPSSDNNNNNNNNNNNSYPVSSSSSSSSATPYYPNQPYAMQQGYVAPSMGPSDNTYPTYPGYGQPQYNP